MELTVSGKWDLSLVQNNLISIRYFRLNCAKKSTPEKGTYIYSLTKDTSTPPSGITSIHLVTDSCRSDASYSYLL